MITGTYIGSNARLAGKRALLAVSIDNGQTTAQFDDLDIPEAFGWHPFPASDFCFDRLDGVMDNKASSERLENMCNCLICLPESHSNPIYLRGAHCDGDWR